MEDSKQYLDDNVQTDSEDERDKETQKKEISSTKVTLTSQVPAGFSTLLICE